MQIDRRKWLALVTFIAAGWNWKSEAAEDEKALFWRVTAGKSSSILFGYERVGAALVPEIVKDGFRYLDETKSIAQDLSPVVKFPAIEINHGATKPLSNIVSRSVFDQLQGALGKIPQIGEMAKLLSGFEVTSLLLGEGQTPSLPTAAGVIAEQGRTLNRRVAILVSDAEAQGCWNPPDMAALNGSIDEAKIQYLLDLRQQVGPIGAHLETLYRERRGEEINRFTSDIRMHGIVSPTSFLSADKMRPLLFARLVKAMSAPETADAFMFLPLGLLTGADGILAQLRASGNATTPLA